MKIRSLAIAAAFAALVAGCQSIDNAVNATAQSVKTVRDAFNSLLPSDFNGPVALSRHDAYLNLSIMASNVHKGPDGEWHWTYCHLTKTVGIPITPGLTWHSTDEITLGTQ